MITLPKLHWIASPNFNPKRSAKVDLVVIHDTEGGYAGAISWFSQAKSKVSAHFVLREDGQEAVQMVHLDNKAWHCKAFNSRSIGVEMAGFAGKGFGEGEWQGAANVVAWLLKEFGIPWQVALGGQGPGFCSHYMLGAAGGGHRDPTTNAGVWQHFAAKVMAVDVTQLPPSWPFVEVGRAALDHSNMGPD